MQIMILQDPAFFRVEGADQGEGDLDGFLHHIAELPGDQKLPLAFGELGLYEEDRSAGTSPCKAGHHAGNPGRKLLL